MLSLARITPAPPVASEVVQRPDPRQGWLVRGVWEAPVWAFYAVAVAVVVVALAYVAFALRPRKGTD